MSSPLMGRKDTSYYAVCQVPDICKTPMGNSTPPVPYQVIVDFSGSTAFASTVWANDKQAVLLHSTRAPKVTGNEPGTAGGLVSGVNVGKVWMEGHAPNVYAEGIPSVRHLDKCWMNSSK